MNRSESATFLNRNPVKQLTFRVVYASVADALLSGAAVVALLLVNQKGTNGEKVEARESFYTSSERKREREKR